MLDPLYSSVSGSKLISALLLERKFVLNLIKALLAPGVPTLSMLMQGRQMDVKKQPSRSPSAINDNPDRGILAQYNYLFNRRENVQYNYRLKDFSDSDDAKADIKSDKSEENVIDF